VQKIATLGSLGEMWNGFQVRSAIADVPEAPHRLITLGDVVDGVIAFDRPARMDLGDRIQRQALLPGDVLLRTRGANYKAAVVPKLDMPTVATAPLCVLRLRAGAALPEYVAWWINRDEVQESLATSAWGSYIPTVPKEAFARLEIALPDLPVQRQIAEIQRLRSVERELAARLGVLRSRHVDAALEQAILNQAGKR
jgi:hypothetical protein